MNKVSCLKKLLSIVSGKNENEIEGTTVCQILDETCACMKKGKVYSTEEKVVGTWINGKPIYSVSVDTTLGNLAAAINAHHPKKIISFYGEVLSMYGSWMQIPSMVADDSRYKMDMLQSNADFTVAFEYGDFFKPEYSAYATIEYTKE